MIDGLWNINIDVKIYNDVKYCLTWKC